MTCLYKATIELQCCSCLLGAKYEECELVYRLSHRHTLLYNLVNYLWCLTTSFQDDAPFMHFFSFLRALIAEQRSQDGTCGFRVTLPPAVGLHDPNKV